MASGQRGIAATPAALGSADTMEKVFRDEPWNRPPATRLTIEAARNEVEGIQLVVAAGSEKIRSATLEVTDLIGETGGTIPKSNVAWNIVGYVETEKPAYPVSKVGWWPDPLLPAGEFDVPVGQVQPLWINVRVPTDSRPGLYRGTVTLRLVDHQPHSLPLVVRVWNFAIPKQQHLETCFLLRPEELQKFYKLPAVPIEMYEQWIDFCIDHRISVMLCEWPGFNTDMERLVARQLDRGGSTFCLANAWFEQGPSEARRKHNAEQAAQIRALYDRAKKRGWIDRAYVYCHDEIGKEQYAFAQELYGELKKSMPDLRLMQTFYKDDPIPVLGGVLDIWAPNTGRYRAAEFQAQQAKGKTVWWYVCCGPGKPYANLMIEWPAIDHRLLLWQNQKYRVTGFLYWSLDTWRDNLTGEKRWPEVQWKPATWRNDAGMAHNGDGQLIYPGPNRQPLSSIRLENFRDGVEDYEYFWLLKDSVARLKKADAARHQALIAEAEQVLAVDDAVVKDLTHFTHDPQVLRQARARIAHLIERAGSPSQPARPEPVQGMYFAKKQYVAKPLPKFAETKGKLPSPIYDENPLYVQMYWKTWELAFRNFYEPKPGSGFVSQFIDAAFNENAFLWDTCFLTMFCNYGHPLVPGICSLDNFYAKQYEDGEICREINRATGRDYEQWVNGDGKNLFSRWGRFSVKYAGREAPQPPPKLTLDALNHPIFAWAELESVRVTGDRSRLATVYEPLLRYYGALQKYIRQGNGLYMTDWASMDNSPRAPGLFGGGTAIDTSSEMVLFARQLAEIAELLDRKDRGTALRKEAADLARLINAKMWDPQQKFYFDLTVEDKQIPIKTIAAYWTLLAGVASPEQADALAAELRNPRTFGRKHRVPSASADQRDFDPAGGYWRGAVWPSTNTMVIRGLERCGKHALAREIALEHLRMVGEVFRTTGTVWENYAPDDAKPGQPAKGDLVGWAGLAPIVYFIEYAIGLKADAPNNRLTWELTSDKRCGCERFRFNGHTATLVAQPPGNTSGPKELTVESDGQFQLRVERGGKRWDFIVKAGKNRFTLD
jgi:hypothetical protein